MTKPHGTPLSKVNTIYALYPASFASTANTGYGTLQGITQHLDYLQSLGVDRVWLNPIFPSPIHDGWYDVADYRDVHPLFGTLADLDVLIADGKQRGIGFMLDLVANHVSNEHPWFKSASTDPKSPYTDYFIFHPPTDGPEPPSNHQGATGSAWSRLQDGRWYYHTFAPEQPDLNTANPKVLEEILDIVRFWYRRGIMGFRVDAILYAGKRPEDMVKDQPPNPNWKPGMYNLHALIRKYTAFTPGMFKVLKALSAVNTEFEGRVMILESRPDNPDHYRQMYQVLDLASTAPMQLDLVEAKWDADTVRQIVGQFLRDLPDGSWPVFNIGNHDNPRLATRIGQEQVYVAMMLLMLLPGTPVLYYGDEVGMNDGPEPKKPIDTFLNRSRGPARAPLSWTAGPNAGFAPAGVEPWLQLAKNYRECNVEAEQNDPHSLLNLTRQLITMRRDRRALHGLSYADLPTGNDSVYGFRRGDGAHTLTVLLNFSNIAQKVAVPAGLTKVVLSSNPARTDSAGASEITLAPNEALALA